MVKPAGHSLVELTVALVLLSFGLGAAGATALLGYRWTTGAVARQAALAGAEDLLDSLLLAPSPPVGGEWSAEGVTLRWSVDDLEGDPPVAPPGSRRVRVRAWRPGSGDGVSLDGLFVPPLPTLPELP